MDTHSVHDTTVSVIDDDFDGGIEAISVDKSAPENASSEKELIREVGSSLIRFELDIACCSEKLVNMNLLMMHVAERESDFEDFALIKEETSASVDYDAKALEFDILSGLFDSEVREMDSFISGIEAEIKRTCEVISSNKHLGEAFLALEEKLHDTEESLKQLQEQVLELMMQSTKFQKILSSVNQKEASGEYKDVNILGDGELFNTTAKQTAEQQRHILRMLEKSLARELELENELKESMQFLDEMQDELCSSQQKVYYAEEETTAVYAHFLEADSASAVLMGISKELIGKLQLCQFKINSAQRREDDMNTRIQEYTHTVQNLEKKEAAMQELVEKNRLEALALQEKVNVLEEKLRASESALLTSLDGKSEQHEIKELEDKYIAAESRSQKAEADSKFLGEANKKLNEELDFLKNSSVSVEKVDSLEKQLRETDIQLQEATASVEASQEKQALLYSSIDDMEIFIEKLKSKVSEANARADSAEYKCIILSESNSELNKKLNEELDFLKNSSVSVEKVDSLEKQLREKDIQLQEATASVEASQEKQALLYTSIDDMEILIEKLKSKVSEANARADSAEDKCIILSESNAELNEELNFLRGKLECLETSLQQAEETKRTTAKDISIRTKVITDMVMQLAVERERLHKQLSLLMMENKALVEKLDIANKVSPNSTNEETEKGDLSSVQRDNQKRNKEDPIATEGEKSPENVLDREYKLEPQDLDSKLETVRTIDAGRLSIKYVFSASLVVLTAVLALCFLQPGNCPF